MWRRAADACSLCGRIARASHGVRRIDRRADRAAARARAAGDDSHLSGLADLFPAAARMQRAAADLCGVRSRDFDQRPWLRHAAWPADYLPLAIETPLRPRIASRRSIDYAFVRVAGEGVHEIPVGPVHAGIIEPGHFRFSVVGEKVLRLEERLGYVHKGIEQRFTELSASTAIASPRASRAIRPSRTPGRTARHSKASRARRFRRAPPGCGRSPGMRTHRQSSRRPRRTRQRCGIRIRARAVFAAQRAVVARDASPHSGNAI